MAGRRARDMMLLLVRALELALPDFTLTEGSSSGDLTLQVAEDATPAAGEEVAFIKIVQRFYAGFPIPSLASSEDGRAHIVQLVAEESGTAGTVVWGTFTWSQLLARLKDTNMEIEVYIRANGDFPVEGDIASGNLAGTILTDPAHPNSGN